MLSDLISVIVPVYKVENYLDQCVGSIVGQTYKNLEIILVDDGSPDRCPAMCDQWAERDSRIRVIHKANGGLSDARNAGMAIATGKYIGFVDSDDWIGPDMYRLLYDSMMRDHSDIAACGVQMIWEDDTPPRMLTRKGSHTFQTQEAMEAIIQETWLKQPVWYKLYLSDLIREIPFAVGRQHEDAYWSYQVIGQSKRISIFDTPCYFYRQRANSIMGKSYSVKRLDALDAMVIRQTYIETYFPALKLTAKWNLFFACIYVKQQTMLHLRGADQKAANDKLAEILQAHRPSFRDTRILSPKERIWAMMGLISFGGTCRLRNLLHYNV